jgi:hypothetical protein
MPPSFRGLLARWGFQASGLLQRASEQKLDLAVQAAQVVIGPALNGLEQVSVDA